MEARLLDSTRPQIDDRAKILMDLPEWKGGLRTALVRATQENFAREIGEAMREIISDFE